MENKDQIAALAREYGEYEANSLDYDMCSDPELRHKLVAKGNSESAQSVLEWLLRRFCLVEKERLKRVMSLHIEKCDENVKGGKAWFFHNGSASTLRYLFPEIAEEVEE
jgi:hypothetical protein